MMKTSRDIVFRSIALLGVMLNLGCNEMFSPRGPYQQQWVVYSVLTTQSDTQFVRIYSNFNPPEDNPLVAATENPDTAAVVSISDGVQTVFFRDTLLVVANRAAPATPVHAFVSTMFRPLPAKSYTLTVTTSSQTSTSAHTSVPAAEILDVPERYKLYQPGQFADQSIEVVDRFAPQAKGYLCRFLIEYGIRSDSTFRGQLEVPLSIGTGNGGATVPVYQTLQRVTYIFGGAAFPVANYVGVLTQILNQYGNDAVFRLAKFYCIQVDTNLYNYYNIANGFQDAYSTRTDQPDFTNIPNGLGVFGSFNVDSVYYNLDRQLTLPKQSR